MRRKILYLILLLAALVNLVLLFLDRENLIFSGIITFVLLYVLVIRKDDTDGKK